MSGGASVASRGMGDNVPDARPALLDVVQLEELLAGTFSIGQDVGQDRDKVELVRVRLFKALLGACLLYTSPSPRDS